jgi:hypothetical protein
VKTAANWGGCGKLGECNMTPTLKAAMVLILAVSTFNLGRYSVEFSGSGMAWISLICSVIVLAIAAYALVAASVGRDNAKSN